jgi:hypothetical protein
MTPERECKKDDFKKVFSRINITEPSDGAVLTDQTIKIHASVSGEAEVKQVDFFFGEEAIGSDKSSPYEISYKIPAKKNNQIIRIEAKVYDKEGGKDSDTIEVQTAFPTVE